MRFVDNPYEAVLATAKDMLRRSLVEGTAGNISARREGGTIVITPSSVDYDAMQLEDLVVIDAGGKTLHAKEGRLPSSEKKLHVACYQAFDDVGAVIHSHPVCAGCSSTTKGALRLEAELSSRVFRSDDAKEGPLAFADKRPPVWRGR